LESHEVIVDLISATTTRTGLKVHAQLDTTNYPSGVKISDEQMRHIDQHQLRRHLPRRLELHPHTTHTTDYNDVISARAPS
jgi:hypothetical protein